MCPIDEDEAKPRKRPTLQRDVSSRHSSPATQPHLAKVSKVKVETSFDQSQMETMVKLSPKIMEGSIWDENGKTQIVQILISYYESSICSIQFVYNVDGKVVPSKMHGEPCGTKFDIVTFDYPEEYLLSVSGDYQTHGMASIAFGTNKRTYGPFGKKRDSDYHSENFAFNFAPKSSFGGFHGSVKDRRVYGIGVYVRPLGSLAEIEKDFGSGVTKKE